MGSELLSSFRTDPRIQNPKENNSSLTWWLQTLEHEDSPNPNLVGGKGAGLQALCRLTANTHIRVPPAVILTTETWWLLGDNDKLSSLITCAVEEIQRQTNRKLGDPQNPLIVSVRSSPIISMPGIMDTLLNIGINETTLPWLSQRVGEKNAFLLYVKLIIGFAEKVFGIEKSLLSAPENLNELNPEELMNLADRIKNKMAKLNHPFPENTNEQLRLAVSTVFGSLYNERAKAYRELFQMPDIMKTACIIQEMVFGLSEGGKSGSGVLVSHTQNNHPVIIFQKGEQGDYVVGDQKSPHTSLEQFEDENIRASLEEVVNLITLNPQSPFFLKPVEIEVTIQDGEVFLLQVRKTSSSPLSYFRWLLGLAREGKISESQAYEAMSQRQLQELLSPTVSLAEKKSPLPIQILSINNLSKTGILVTNLSDIESDPDQSYIFVGHMTKEAFSCLNKLRKSLVAIIVTNLCLGSHTFQALAAFCNQNGIALGLVEGENVEVKNQVFTFDGVNGKLYPGKVPFSRSGLSEEEENTARSWLMKRENYPWASVAGINPDTIQPLIIDNFYNLPHKAQEVAAVNAIFGETEIAIPATIVASPSLEETQESIRQMLKEIIERGNHATIRTVHEPPLLGRAPWLLVSDLNDVEKIFSDPNYSRKYGNYYQAIQPIRECEVPYVIISEIPPGKLNPQLSADHAVFTLTPIDDQIVVQIRPHTPHLRDLEPDDKVLPAENVITVIFEKTSFGYWLPIRQTAGRNVEDEGKRMARAIIDGVGRWLNEEEIAEKMARLNLLFPPNKYITPVLQAQARFSPDPTRISWMKVYGINADSFN